MDLTVLIVTRDRPVLLEHAIRSVQASARAAAGEVATRILVVDDSEDGNAVPVAERLEVEARRNPVRVPRNGLSAGRAWAIPQVQTDLVALFDDDDLMLEDHIPRLLGRILDGAEIVPTGYWYADPDPADVTRLVPRAKPVLFGEPRLGDLLAGYQPVNDGAMMLTGVAQSVRWDASREIQMMYDVWLQLLFAGRRFSVNPTATFLYRQHAGSLTRRMGEREDVIRKALLDEYRALAVERFGRVPPPSARVRAQNLRRSLRRALRP
jgi:succinoglycan biosynthesis protein ExoO